MSGNPFFETWDTPFEAPPFASIAPEHFRPAFDRAIEEHEAEIEAIKADPAEPGFDDTIAALERAGRAMSRIGGVFWNLAGADTNDEIQGIEREMSPVLARHWQKVGLDPDLFARVAAVHARRDALDLTAEQRRVLDLTYDGFVRGGAELGDADRKRLAEIAERLAGLGTRFGQNVLHDEKAFTLVLEGEDDLAGLPPALRDAAAQAAAERGLPGKHVVTLGRSLIEPFLRFSARRDLREAAFRAFATRGEHEGEHDNRPVVAEMAQLRAERAALLGFPTYAHLKLDDTMAKTPEAVRGLLDRVWERARAKAAKDEEKLGEVVREEGHNFALAPHDWRHYAEKVRRRDYDLDESEIKGYLALENIAAAAFDTATKLFGLTFTPRPDVPVYHPDVRAFEVKDRDGAPVALFLADYFARPSKRSGAWMSGFRGQNNLDGLRQRPIVVNVMNFAKGGEGEPTLLSMDDARTLFHEFGHALHGMLSDVTYPSIAGTGVSRDFVEFPSQLYEHWMTRPEVLKRFALHHETGEPMPDALYERLQAARNFSQGFGTVEYCASAIVDMAFHTLTPEEARSGVDPERIERDTLAAIGMPDAIVMRHRTPHFAHVFAGDSYSAGYYSYLWSEMLDADGFGAFEENGVFDPATAERLRANVLAAGNTRPPEEAYLAFRGRVPSVDTLLERRGLN
ncbi:M3 family metallopeptidase [Lichenibacterium dinghuense]|uniref:M3 family metallopeptidase n=1 Tax=Lichenibacterium dinghuense TaxID=2895977 RepID=UPI001F3FC56A|nr:M3 family metallopeptidase [Lichenibacterium sp. 6Y81]